MTQDEIIEIATQVYGKCVWHESAVLHLEAFAKLVAAKTLAQRTWVGLDDDELTEAWHWGGCEPHIEGAHFKALYQYFEAKLKDKNYVAQKTD